MSVGLLKSQDILLLCKLVVSESPESLKQKDLSQTLGLNQSEISTGYNRLNEVHLLEGKNPNRYEALQFLLHAVQFFFPARHTGISLGMPTALSAPPLKKMLHKEANNEIVWAHSKGNTRGIGFAPIHKSVPYACETDEKLYRLMTLIDALRIERSPRVRKVTSNQIERIVMGEKHES